MVGHSINWDNYETRCESCEGSGFTRNQRGYPTYCFICNGAGMLLNEDGEQLISLIARHLKARERGAK